MNIFVELNLLILNLTSALQLYQYFHQKLESDIFCTKKFMFAHKKKFESCSCSLTKRPTQFPFNNWLYSTLTVASNSGSSSYASSHAPITPTFYTKRLWFVLTTNMPSEVCITHGRLIVFCAYLVFTCVGSRSIRKTCHKVLEVIRQPAATTLTSKTKE